MGCIQGGSMGYVYRGGGNGGRIQGEHLKVGLAGPKTQPLI